MSSCPASKLIFIFFMTGLLIATLSKVVAETEMCPDDVNYLAYVQNSQPIEVNIQTASQIFDQSKPTVIIVHGWRCHGNATWIWRLAKAYSDRGPCNILVVDWSKLGFGKYFPTAKSVHLTARHAANFVCQLSEKGLISGESTHFIGHSLGAHFVGITAQLVYEQCDVKIDRITGLDPAGPHFEVPFRVPIASRLSCDDATFVDVVHTNAGREGASRSYGNVDFYINNGGPYQPGCEKLEDMKAKSSCSHQSAHVYYTKALLKRGEFVGYRCKNRRMKLKNPEGCEKEVRNWLGETTLRNVTGNFFIDTDSSPYLDC